MAFWRATKSLFSGHPSDAFNYLFTDEDDITEQAANNNVLTRRVNEQAAEGVISQEEADSFMSQIGRNAYPYIWEEQGSPGGEFVASIKESAANPGNLLSPISEWLNKTITGISKAVFRALPWYIWGLGVLAAIIYFWPILGPVIGSINSMRKKK